jgi:hypothetical protein
MPVNYQEAGIITFPSGKRKAVDGKTRDQYSCRLNAEDEAQIAELTERIFILSYSIVLSRRYLDFLLSTVEFGRQPKSEVPLHREVEFLGANKQFGL